MSRSGLQSDYQLAVYDHLPHLGEHSTVLYFGSGIQRFDYKSNRWVVDGEMAHVFLGSPSVTPITEQQAQWTIENFGGTWALPPELGTPRADALTKHMVENADSVPTPKWAERIKSFDRDWTWAG